MDIYAISFGQSVNLTGNQNVYDYYDPLWHENGPDGWTQWFFFPSWITMKFVCLGLSFFVFTYLFGKIHALFNSGQAMVSIICHNFQLKASNPFFIISAGKKKSVSY